MKKLLLIIGSSALIGSVMADNMSSAPVSSHQNVTPKTNTAKKKTTTSHHKHKSKKHHKSNTSHA